MHIIIGVLTALAGLVWALYRLQNSGVDLNAFNPFYWARRRAWAKKHGVKPLHNLTKPMDAAALLLVGMAKQEGDISREHKRLILELFEQEFKLSVSEAAELYFSSCHLLRDTVNFSGEIKAILAPTRVQFSTANVESLCVMLRKVGEFESPLSDHQQKVLAEVEQNLTTNLAQKQW